MNRVFGLDLLRAIAVLMVLVAHSRFAWEELDRFADLSIFGFLGVELFFVLSGFLIGGILIRSLSDEPTPRELRTFWVRRWFRTLPNYYLFLVLNLGLWLWVIGKPLKGVAWYAVFLQNFAWACPLFYGESWSLAVEEWFYLLFPLVFFAALKARLGVRRACLAALIAVLVLSTGGRILAATVLHGSWAVVRKAVVYRLDALMVGVLGAWLKAYHRAGWEKAGRAMAVAGVVLFAVVFTSYTETEGASFFRRTLLFNVTSLAVFCFLPVLDGWRTSSRPGARWVERISLWSYSLYLCHLPLQEVMLRTLGAPGARVPPAAWLALWAATAIGLSGLLFRYFEHPLTTLRSRFDGAPVRPLTGAA